MAAESGKVDFTLSDKSREILPQLISKLNEMPESGKIFMYGYMQGMSDQKVLKNGESKN